MTQTQGKNIESNRNTFHSKFLIEFFSNSTVETLFYSSRQFHDRFSRFFSPRFRMNLNFLSRSTEKKLFCDRKFLLSNVEKRCRPIWTVRMTLTMFYLTSASLDELWITEDFLQNDFSRLTDRNQTVFLAPVIRAEILDRTEFII